MNGCLCRKKRDFLFERKMKRQEIQAYLEAHKNVTERYPFKVSDYYLALIKEEGDGIWLQCMPSDKELENPDGLQDDGLGEHGQSPCPRLIHRYPDRVAFFATNRCFSYCRFCFRKRFWKCGNTESAVTDEQFNAILAYLEKHREVKDVLLTGGDPLTMPDERIEFLLKKLFSAGGVETVRLCTRAPVFQPDRMTEALAERLSQFTGLWLVTHYNHPAELTDEAMRACGRFRKKGIPLLNQTVLLKGVNDDVNTLTAVFRGLVRNGIKPLYLFHCDPILGTAHFATGIDKGLAMLRIFRRNLSSIATPFFAIDLPEGGGKVCLQPDYEADGGKGFYYTIDGRKVFHPLTVRGDNPGKS